METRTLLGKVIVITGASSGFGKGAALAMADEGASLVLAARRSELLDELANECAAKNVSAIAVPADVKNRVEVEHLCDVAVRQFGRIDVWINNAGVGVLGPFERVPLEDHVQVIETNLLGTLYGSWFAYRQFLRQGRGTLINVASELGRHTVPYYGSYAAAKHGVVGLDDALRQEIEVNGHEDVHVCTVMPTAHDTPFFDHAGNYTGHEVQAPKPLHDPQGVVRALVRLAREPKANEIVGGDGVLKILMKNLAPRLLERMAAKQIQKQQMEEAPLAADTPGAVRQPMVQGTDVRAGRA